MPILHGRFFSFSLIFDHFAPLWFFTFSVPLRVNPHWLEGGAVSAPSSRTIATVFSMPSFTLICHTLCKFGDYRLELFFSYNLYRFLWRHFLAVFDPRGLNVWKFVKNRVFVQNANKNNENTYNYRLYKNTSSDFQKNGFLFEKCLNPFFYKNDKALRFLNRNKP